MKYLIFILSLLVLPTVTLAADTSLASLAGCTGTDCSACNAVGMANGLIKWLIGMLFLVFAIVAAIAGFGLVTSGGNHHALDEAKNKFINAFVGLLIVLSAWLIVDTIMRGLVGSSDNPGQVGASWSSEGEVTGWLFWSEVSCFKQADTVESEWQNQDEAYTPQEMDDFLIDDGTGFAGTIQVNVPGGGSGSVSQSIDLAPCDTSNLVTVNFLGGSVTIRREFAPSLQRIDAAWRARGGDAGFYNVTSVGGYNCRKIAGSNRWSNHAYGVAIDINPSRNPHTRPGSSNYGATDMPAAFVNLFRSEGWGWGGNWNSSKDTMHYSKATGEGGNMRGG